MTRRFARGMKQMAGLLYLFALFTAFAAHAETETQYLSPGITLAHKQTSDPLNAFFLIVDLKTPGVRLHPVLGKDYYGGYETVSSMAKRYGALAAINGDYFGWGHGPEGLNLALGAPTYLGWGRSAVNLSSQHEVNIDLAESLYNGWRAGTIDLFNCLGGGPIFMRNKQVIWNYTATTINGEDFATGGAWSSRQPWTAIGISSDGNQLVLAVVDGRQPALSRGVTPYEMGGLLVEMGASDAIKMDGGGSSEMVVNNQVLNSPSDGNERLVANALLVFYEPPIDD